MKMDSNVAVLWNLLMWWL